jgi:hypothetical protein
VCGVWVLGVEGGEYLRRSRPRFVSSIFDFDVEQNKGFCISDEEEVSSQALAKKEVNMRSLGERAPDKSDSTKCLHFPSSVIDPRPVMWSLNRKRLKLHGIVHCSALRYSVLQRRH